MENEQLTAPGTERERHGEAPAEILPASNPAALSALGLPETALSEPTTMSPKAKRSAWALGISGAVAAGALAWGALVVLDWAIPYLRYLYFVMLGAGEAGL